MTHDRFEVMPFARAEEEAAQLPESVRLTVTCSPKHGPDESVAVAGRLHELGHHVTVHLAARMVRDRRHLDALLGAMAEAGVDDAFVVGGDQDPPLGEFGSAVELLPLIHEHPQRPAALGIAGYPEGHPLIPDAVLADAFEQKSGLADYATTQLCFDPEAILRFARSTQLPVLAGVPGNVNPKRLLEISLRVGVGPSLSYLRKQRSVRALLRLSGEEMARLHGELAPHAEIAGFHYFTFNQLLDTWGWVKDTWTKEVAT